MLIQIRDPVHNFIELNGKEQQVASTPIFQRLRGIRQLALASLIYPGALHTRFDHSLGVMHIAGQMASELGLDEEEKQLVRLAALLHDIGHGPFSHVSENALDRYADRSTLDPSQKKEKIHELVSAKMIENNHELIKELGQNACENIAILLASGHGERILRQIVSGPLDADKQDYLLRDSYFCGVQYGVFDHHQLHRSLLSIKQSDQHDHVLMIKPDGVHAVEQFVLAKYYLTTNVYRHKVRLITDQMIVRAICLGIEIDEIEKMRAIYTFDNTPEFAARYGLWNDARFLQEFGCNQTDGKCKKMLNLLVERKLLKRIFSGRPSDFQEEVRERLLMLVKQNSDDDVQKKLDITRKRVEKHIAEIIGKEIGKKIDSDFLIYHAFNIKSVKEMSKNDEAPILVDTHPFPKKFEDESMLFKSINESLNEEFVEIYAPVDWNYRSKREKICDNLRGPIIEAIEKELLDRNQGETA